MPPQNNYTVIDHNKMDKIQFNRVLSNSVILKDSLRQGNYVFDEFENLMFDIFLLLYKPVLLVAQSADNAHEMLQYSIIQAYLHSPAINKIRLKTAGNRSNTYMSLKWLLDKIFERTRGTSWFSDALKEAETADFENMFSNQDANFDDLDVDESLDETPSNFNNFDDILEQIEKNIDKNLFSDKAYEFLESIEQNRLAMDKEDSSNTDNSNDDEFNEQNNTFNNNDTPSDEENGGMSICPPHEDETSTSEKNELAFDILSEAFSDENSNEFSAEESNPLSESIENALEQLENQTQQDNEDGFSALERLLNEIDKQMQQQNSDEDSNQDDTLTDDSEQLNAQSENMPNDNENLSIDSSDDSEEDSEQSPEQLIEGELDSEGNEKSSVPPSESSENSNQNPDDTDSDKDDSDRKSTLKDEILEELNASFENIIKSDSKENTNSSYSASDNIDANEQMDSSHIQSGQYKGSNQATSMEFRATKKKWNPAESPKKSKYQDIIPEKLKKRMDNFHLNDDLNRAETSILEFEASIDTLGIHKPSIEKLSLDDLLKLHKRFHAPLFLDFVNKVGRQKVCARRVMGKKKIKKRFHPRDTLTRSQDLDLLVDDEFINISLDIEAFENDFYDRYLRNDLLTVEMTQEVGQYKGPIILCYDGSGSMEGTKLEETQSHILSIIEIARIQKRSLILIQFASASEPLFIKKINPNKIDVRDVLDILDTFLCGGTDFEKPLSVAIDFIKADKKNHSDILFITDGECEISQNFLESFMKVKEERKFQLYTIMIHSFTYQDYGNIGEISDEVLEIGEKNWKIDVDQHLFGML